MLHNNLVDKLISALRYLPGVGPRSAQRMAFYLLQQNRDKGMILAQALSEAITKIGNCSRCRSFSEDSLCGICSNQNRDHTLLCIVETQADIVAIEQTNSYHGIYFVLTGHLSPIDGIGPDELGINELLGLFNKEHLIKEVIIATNSTVEGEATAHYLACLLRDKNVVRTRIAYGMPLGGELEYIDAHTLTRAISGRTSIID